MSSIRLMVDFSRNYTKMFTWLNICFTCLILQCIFVLKTNIFFWLIFTTFRAASHWTQIILATTPSNILISENNTGDHDSKEIHWIFIRKRSRNVSKAPQVLYNSVLCAIKHKRGRVIAATYVFIMYYETEGLCHSKRGGCR